MIIGGSLTPLNPLEDIARCVDVKVRRGDDNERPTVQNVRGDSSPNSPWLKTFVT